ncbi:MAG: hypothetical protein IJ655_05275 [Lachnospiraceae bacterium]|nr:hypothetical protein [Lachnospiraceae bacterium]
MINTKWKLDSMFSKKQWTVVLIMSFLSAILFEHIYDAKTIAEWSMILIDCVCNGEISEYQHILAGMEIQSNYTLFLNFLISIWVTPVYIIMQLFHLEAHFRIATFWIKCLLIICNLGTARIMQLILESAGVDKKHQEWVAIIYILSPFVQIYSIAMGQVDGVALFCCMLAYYFFTRNNYILFVLFNVFALMIKPFAGFIIAPIMVIIWWRDKLKSILYVVVIIALYLIQNRAQDLIVKDYNEGSAFWNTFVFLPRLMKYNVAGVPLVLIILFVIGMVCLYRGKKSELSLKKLCFYQLALLVTFESMVTQHPQWYVYFAAISIMIVFGLADSRKSILTYYICEWIFCLNALISFDDGQLIHAYGNRGIPGKISEYSGIVSGEVMSDVFCLNENIARSLLALISIILMIILGYEINKRNVEITENQKQIKLWLFALPTVSLFVVIFVGYIFPINI